MGQGWPVHQDLVVSACPLVRDDGRVVFEQVGSKCFYCIVDGLSMAERGRPGGGRQVCVFPAISSFRLDAQRIAALCLLVEKDSRGE
jgi:hypothetical protein